MSTDSNYISFQDVYFYYNKSNKVLNGINLHLDKGKIFALLGANGNGKTSMIKLLVGLVKPISGKILINGKEPGSKGLDVPGRRVGYMPQEIALNTNLTIEQTFYYYGHVFGMSDKQIEYRIRYLYENIDLNKRHKAIGTLSGGQQRSVSMALTLIHSPELVIWDEPTVGLDPISRDKMWRFLFRLCREEGLTVLITTHYIEEAKQTDQVAFIYHGICLEQNSPQSLLNKYECSTLEEVSFRACCNYEADHVKGIALTSPNTEKKVKSIVHWDSSSLKLDLSHVKALLRKMMIEVGKNFAVVFMFVGLAMIVLPLPRFAFGPPRNMLIGIHDNDCTNLTRSFITNLESDNIRHHQFKLARQGFDAVVKGRNVIFANIPKGFTDKVNDIALGHLEDEFDQDVEENLTISSNDQADDIARLLGNSTDKSMKLYMDNTDPVSSYYALVNTLNAFQEASETSLNIADGDNSTRRLMINTFPIRVKETLNGDFSVEFKDSMACALLIVMAFHNSMYLSGFILVTERESGVKYRDRVSGITKLELVVANFIFCLIWSIIGIMSLLSTMIVVYKSVVMARLLEAFLLSVVVSIEGIAIGTVFALVFNSSMAIGGIFFAAQMFLVMTSGVVWPVQALPKLFQLWSFTFPYTKAISSMQSLLISGLSLLSLQAIPGLLVPLLYILITPFVSVSLIALKRR